MLPWYEPRSGRQLANLSTVPKAVVACFGGRSLPKDRDDSHQPVTWKPDRGSASASRACKSRPTSPRRGGVHWFGARREWRAPGLVSGTGTKRGETPKTQQCLVT